MYRPTFTNSIGHCRNEPYPSSYHRSSNSDYKIFIKKFIDTINDLNKQVYELKKTNAFSLDMDLLNHKSETMNILLGTNCQLAPRSNPLDLLNRRNEIEKINKKIGILKNAVDTSTEHNFHNKRQEALTDLETLENPLARLTQTNKPY